MPKNSALKAEIEKYRAEIAKKDEEIAVLRKATASEDMTELGAMQEIIKDLLTKVDDIKRESESREVALKKCQEQLKQYEFEEVNDVCEQAVKAKKKRWSSWLW